MYSNAVVVSVDSGIYTSGSYSLRIGYVETARNRSLNMWLMVREIERFIYAFFGLKSSCLVVLDFAVFVLCGRKAEKKMKSFNCIFVSVYWMR